MALKTEGPRRPRLRPPLPARLRWRSYAGGAVGVAALGLVHALVVAPRYHVGSFDDDASYVLAARALAAGHGLTSRLAGGHPLVGVYPPGYPALLSPLSAVWPSGVLAFRVLSLVLFVAILPLTWRYLGGRGVAEPLRLVVLALLALNPVPATYATMVMPEIAFVVVVLLMMLAIDRWQQEERTITWAGAGSVLCAAGLLWLKEAGVGLVIGVVAWLVLRRLWRKALLAAVAPALLLVPLAVMRVAAGTNLIGSRYSHDLGPVFRGGLVARFLHVVPDAAWTYVTEAVPRSIAPIRDGFLPSHGPIGAVLPLLTWTAAPLVVAGFVMWCRRHRDAACLAVPVYLAETLVYPFTNERRVVLVLPFIIAWYVLGASWLFTAGRGAGRRRGGRLLPSVGVGLPVLASILLLAALVSQFTRDYLFFEGAGSSSPGGSPYMAFLRQAGAWQDTVETDYLWTTALYSGHRTANGAYVAGCDRRPIADAIRGDAAGYLLTANLNGAGVVDDACLLAAVAGLPGAVRLYRTAHDLASVFELIGPGTGHPALRDLTSGAQLAASAPMTQVPERPQSVGDPSGRYPTVPAADGVATLTWSWTGAPPVSQVSLGGAGIEARAPGVAATPTSSVVIEMQGPDGTWHRLDSSPGPIGAGHRMQYLLAQFPQPVSAHAVRITVTGQGRAAVHDLHVLGST